MFSPFQGSLNPNEIKAQPIILKNTTKPEVANEFKLLQSSNGPAYSFGVLLNGVELDPIAAEPFPHEGIMSQNVNWEWNVEAPNVLIDLDCNNAHVQLQGKYHYRGSSTLYLENIETPSNSMTLIGYGGDGFPIYYKYAYKDPLDNSSAVIEMSSNTDLNNGKDQAMVFILMILNFILKGLNLLNYRMNYSLISPKNT